VAQTGEGRARRVLMVRAAGGVVVREDGGAREVVVVHRPAYDDWTLPKGKARKGESDEDCAVREVQEETGLRCKRGRELASTSYLDSAGREKLVRYWLMRPADGTLRPSNEVDEARWISFDEADRLLTYEHDRVVLRSAVRS
jgi:8-oxo-dGTP pyrophosphatase MutT (NUDIX family)